jgi:hypothetical protein
VTSPKANISNTGVSDIHIVNCIATLMSARFPQDVTDMILPLDQSMQHIQYKKYTSGAFRFIILEFLFSYWHFLHEDEFTIAKKNYELKLV